LDWLLHRNCSALHSSFLAHASNIDDLLEGLDGVFKDWLDRLHDTKSSLHIVDLWLHTLNGFHLSGNFDKGLSVIESLKDSSGKGFLDVLDGSSLGNGGGFIVSGFGSEGGVKSRFEAGYKLGVRHGFELGFFVNELNIMVMVVVSGLNGDSKSSNGGEFHFVFVNFFD